MISARDAIRIEERAAVYRRANAAAERWSAGYGQIHHRPETQARLFELADLLVAEAGPSDGVPLFEMLEAADRLANAAMWMVVHMTYARNVYLDGRDLEPADFKPDPEGHTGGSLNMVPAYVGYLVANALTGTTRGWIMGQGHTVSAIDSVNVLVGNTTDEHAARYEVSDEGLSRMVRDFYSYRLDERGRQASALGSHVNAYTAGGLAEGGYLGFTELQYVHMPLPGERLTVFLSDGEFEEQRGSDWAPRWWRADDSGSVAPIMIANGRRIDQRTTMSQEGGTEWFEAHLRLNGFDPIVFDGRDPAAFAWAILEIESRLDAAGQTIRDRTAEYPVLLPYGIAVAPKGAGFPGEGTNLAHNLPLGANPSIDTEAAETFNEGARKLWVPPDELRDAAARFGRHQASTRPREKDNVFVTRDVPEPSLPEPAYRPVPADRADTASWTRASAMRAIDDQFVAITKANPHLRPRVGNPDEMRSNRMQMTLDELKFRVTAPERGVPEDVHGAVVTALNEEAIASAALGNKGGLNIIVTYEAFGAKMHGVVRQEITFAKQCKEAGRPPRWLSVPLVLTSHVWENAKNEFSHQDPVMAEAMLNEHGDVSRVVFVPDANVAGAALTRAYSTRGQVWTFVAPKVDVVADLFTPDEAGRLLDEGALDLGWAGHRPEESEVILTAIGAYQLEEVLKASNRLRDRDVPHRVVCMLEPGRFREPRDRWEGEHVVASSIVDRLYPRDVAARVFASHTRPEPMLGVLQRLNTGAGRTAGLGFRNQGGTLSIQGLLFINRCTWAHVTEAVAAVTGRERNALLAPQEVDALDGRGSPEGVIVAATPVEPPLPATAR